MITYVFLLDSVYDITVLRPKILCYIRLFRLDVNPESIRFEFKSGLPIDWY